MKPTVKAATGTQEPIEVTTPEVQELVPIEVSSIEPLDVTAESLKERFDLVTKQRQVMTDFVTKNMKEGIDYGRIGAFPKPTLLKPGAEKLCSLFSLTASFTKDTETMEMAGDFAKQDGTLAYICHLRTRDGNVVGEGRGSCSITSKRGDINTATKIAEKRAQMDAVLRTMSVSEFFTQDLEDMEAPQQPTTPARDYRMSPGVADAKVSEAQLNYLFRIINHAGITKEKFEEYLRTEYNILGIENIPKVKASRLIDGLLQQYGPIPPSTGAYGTEAIKAEQKKPAETTEVESPPFIVYDEEEELK